jgi:hypothetical protein
LVIAVLMRLYLQVVWIRLIAKERQLTIVAAQIGD